MKVEEISILCSITNVLHDVGPNETRSGVAAIKNAAAAACGSERSALKKTLSLEP